MKLLEFALLVAVDFSRRMFVTAVDVSHHRYMWTQMLLASQLNVNINVYDDCYSSLYVSGTLGDLGMNQSPRRIETLTVDGLFKVPSTNHQRLWISSTDVTSPCDKPLDDREC